MRPIRCIRNYPLAFSVEGTGKTLLTRAYGTHHSAFSLQSGVIAWQPHCPKSNEFDVRLMELTIYNNPRHLLLALIVKFVDRVEALCMCP